MTDFWITDYGANANAADNQAAINAAIAAAVAAGGAPNHCVRVPAGIFNHSGVIKATVSIIGINSDKTRGAVSGFDGTQANRAVQIDGSVTGSKQIIVENLYLTGTPLARQPATIEKSAVLVRNGASNWIIRNCFVEGKNQNPDADDTTPNMAGFFIYGASYGLITRNTLRFTTADAIHVTKGGASHHIIIEYNRIDYAGDDCTAFVTYNVLDRVHDCISRYNSAYWGRNGRFFTSIGSIDCQIVYNYGENSSQTVPKNNGGKAGIMIAAENAYETAGSVRLKVYRNTLLQVGGTGTGHGAIHLYTSGFSYSTKPDWVHTDVTIEDNQIVQPRRAGMVINGTDGGTNTKLINNKVYGLASGQSALSMDAAIPRRGYVNTGTQTFALADWASVKPHAIKNIGGAHTTARHPADPLYNGAEPVPDPPVDPEPPPSLPTGAVSKTITTISGALLRQGPDVPLATMWTVDSDNPTGTGQKDMTLIRIDNLVGTGAGQIPAGATIHSAILKVQTTDPGPNCTFHKMLVDWNASTATWSSMGNGVSADGVEASSVADLSTGATTVGLSSIDVKRSVQDWVGGVPNFGWIIIGGAGTVDGWTFYSSAGPTPPKLEVVYVPAPSIPEEPEIPDTVIASGSVPAGSNQIRFVSSSEVVKLRFAIAGAGSVKVRNIVFKRVENETIWTTGGPGTVTTTDTSVTITGTGVEPTYAFRSLPTEPDTRCRVDFTVAGGSVSAKLGIGGELIPLTSIPVGPGSFTFPAIIQPILWFEKLTGGAATVTNISLTQLSPHVWSTSGPGTVTISSNSSITITPVTNTTATIAYRPFGTIPKREYLLTYNQTGSDLTRNMGDTQPAGTSVSNTATSTVGATSLRVWARSNQTYLRFYRATASTAIAVTNILMSLVPLELATAWLTTGNTSVNPDDGSISLISDGVTAATAKRTYNTHATATYRLIFRVTDGDCTYRIGSTDGGTQIVPDTTATTGSTVTIDFTGAPTTTHLQISKTNTGSVVISRPDIDLYEVTA